MARRKKSDAPAAAVAAPDAAPPAPAVERSGDAPPDPAPDGASVEPEQFILIGIADGPPDGPDASKRLRLSAGYLAERMKAPSPDAEAADTAAAAALLEVSSQSPKDAARRSALELAKRNFAEPFWPTRWVLGWIAFRVPELIESSWIGAQLYDADQSDPAEHLRDEDCRKTLLRALQAGAIHAIDRKTGRMDRDAWAHATVGDLGEDARRWDAHAWRFRREEVLALWPDARPGADTPEAAQGHQEPALIDSLVAAPPLAASAAGVPPAPLTAAVPAADTPGAAPAPPEPEPPAGAVRTCDDLLTTQQVASYLAKIKKPYAVHTLENWRDKDKNKDRNKDVWCGPHFEKHGWKPLYRKADVDAWVETKFLPPKNSSRECSFCSRTFPRDSKPACDRAAAKSSSCLRGPLPAKEVIYDFNSHRSEHALAAQRGRQGPHRCRISS